MNYKDFSYTSERKTNNITKLTTQLATIWNLEKFRVFQGLIW